MGLGDPRPWQPKLMKRPVVKVPRAPRPYGPPKPKAIRVKVEPTPEMLSAKAAAKRERLRAYWTKRFEDPAFQIQRREYQREYKRALRAKEKATRRVPDQDRLKEVNYQQGQELTRRLYKVSEDGLPDHWEISVTNLIIARCIDNRVTIESLYGLSNHSNRMPEKNCLRACLHAIRNRFNVDSALLSRIFRLQPGVADRLINFKPRKKDDLCKVLPFAPGAPSRRTFLESCSAA